VANIAGSSQCVVGVAGKITDRPRSKTVYHGEKTVAFMCNSNGEIQLLSWYVKLFSSRETKIVAKGYNLHDPKSTKYSVPKYRARPDEFGQGDKMYVLEIHNIEFDDAGEYICRESADNVADPDSASANLTVVKQPETREGMYRHNCAIQAIQQLCTILYYICENVQI